MKLLISISDEIKLIENTNKGIFMKTLLFFIIISSLIISIPNAKILEKYGGDEGRPQELEPAAIKNKIFFVYDDMNPFLSYTFKEILIRRGWLEYNPEDRDKYNNDFGDPSFDNTIDLVFGNYGAEALYEKRAKIKNFIGKVKRCLVDKCWLTRYINNYSDMIGMNDAKNDKDTKLAIATDAKYIKEHTPKSQFLHEDAIDFKGEEDIKIVKPCGLSFYLGKGIYLVKNAAEMSEIKKVYPKEMIAADIGRRKLNDLLGIIVSEYIINTMLLGNYKMHFRMYMLISLEPNLTYKLFHNGEILTAVLPYKKEDWNNKQIHDTHGSPEADYYTTKDDWKLLRKKDNEPVTVEDMANMYIQMNKICSILFNIFKNELALNPKNAFYSENENKFAFEIFGIDFMVSDDCDIFLLEVNDKIGHKFLGKKNKDNLKKLAFFNYDFFENVYRYAVKPFENYL